MAPDQLESGIYDARSEVYSIGCILFEMLTGRQVYSGENALAIIYKHKTEAPPSVLSYLPAETLAKKMDKVISRCLAKSPAGRYQTVNELLDALLDQSRTREGMTGSWILEERSEAPASWKRLAIFAVAISVPLAIATFSMLAHLHQNTQPGKSEKANSKRAKSKHSDAKLDTRQFDQLELRPLENINVAAGHRATLMFFGKSAARSMREAVRQNPQERYKTFIFYASELKDEDMEFIVKLDPLVVCVSGSPELTDKTLMLLSTLKGLDRLELEDSKKFSAGAMEKLKVVPKLEYISLKNCDLIDDHLQALSQIKALVKLNVSGCKRITRKGLAYFAGRNETITIVAENCPGLKLYPENLRQLAASDNIVVETVDEGSVDPDSMMKDLVDSEGG
jgi:hypothetical protein